MRGTSLNTRILSLRTTFAQHASFKINFDFPPGEIGFNFLREVEDRELTKRFMLDLTQYDATYLLYKGSVHYDAFFEA